LDGRDTDLREVVEDPYEGWIVVLLLSKLLQKVLFPWRCR
jgi:hypothetical protein